MHEKCMHFTHKPLVVKITLPEKSDISKMAFLPRRLIALEQLISCFQQNVM